MVLKIAVYIFCCFFFKCDIPLCPVMFQCFAQKLKQYYMLFRPFSLKNCICVSMFVKTLHRMDWIEYSFDSNPLLKGMV